MRAGAHLVDLLGQVPKILAACAGERCGCGCRMRTLCLAAADGLRKGWVASYRCFQLLQGAASDLVSRVPALGPVHEQQDQEWIIFEKMNEEGNNHTRNYVTSDSVSNLHSECPGKFMFCKVC